MINEIWIRWKNYDKICANDDIKIQLIDSLETYAYVTRRNLLYKSADVRELSWMSHDVSFEVFCKIGVLECNVY